MSGACLPFLSIARHGLDDVVDPAIDSIGEIVGAQTWDEEFSMISFDTASGSVPSKP